tara:strand:- start:5957 stop:6397 length:441 start_codon:yes stop_codon:yes gene_type:complete
MATEPLPINEFITDLEGQWTASNVSKPAFIEVTGANEPIRFNLNVNDHIIGRAGSPAVQETPIGNWTYGNRVYNLELEVHTLNSRQRLYDLMREIRRICHARASSLTNFQRIQFMDFTELTAEQVNLWSGTVNLQLQNYAVTLETT